MNKFILFLMVIFIAGCAGNKVSEINTLEKPPGIVYLPEPTVTASSPPKTTSIIIEANKQNTSNNYNLLYKAYLYPSDKLQTELNTFVYLPKKPTTDKELKLYKQICDEWSYAVLSYADASSHHDNNSENLIPFYWFVKTKPSTFNCDSMIEQYDYARARQIMRKVKLDINKTQFVALYKEVKVTMNISSLTEEEDIVKALQGWSTYMTKTPDKDDIIYVFNMIDSLKKVLGALEYLVTTKLKG